MALMISAILGVGAALWATSHAPRGSPHHDGVFSAFSQRRLYGSNRTNDRIGSGENWTNWTDFNGNATGSGELFSVLSAK